MNEVHPPAVALRKGAESLLRLGVGAAIQGQAVLLRRVPDPEEAHRAVGTGCEPPAVRRLPLDAGDDGVARQEAVIRQKLRGCQLHPPGGGCRRQPRLHLLLAEAQGDARAAGVIAPVPVDRQGRERHVLPPGVPVPVLRDVVAEDALVAHPLAELRHGDAFQAVHHPGTGVLAAPRAGLGLPALSGGPEAADDQAQAGRRGSPAKPAGLSFFWRSVCRRHVGGVDELHLLQQFVSSHRM